MLPFVDCNCEELVLHILTSRSAQKETQVYIRRVMKICQHFSGSCIEFLELISFESEEKNRRQLEELSTFIKIQLLFTTAILPCSSVSILS